MREIRRDVALIRDQQLALILRALSPWPERVRRVKSMLGSESQRP